MSLLVNILTRKIVNFFLSKQAIKLLASFISINLPFSISWFHITPLSATKGAKIYEIDIHVINSHCKILFSKMLKKIVECLTIDVLRTLQILKWIQVFLNYFSLLKNYEKVIIMKIEYKKVNVQNSRA